MRTKGLEPSLREKLEPKSSASTNSAMSAGINLIYHSTLFPERKPPTNSNSHYVISTRGTQVVEEGLARG
jgi:hypothetical protein